MPTVANATHEPQRIRVLHSDREYRNAVAFAKKLLAENPRRGTDEYEMLELLMVLIEHYESENMPEPPTPTPQALVEFMLEQKGMTRADLVEPLGGKSRVSEFFARKRPLSTGQIKALRSLLGIPADLLLESEEEEQERTQLGVPEKRLVKVVLSEKRIPARKK